MDELEHGVSEASESKFRILEEENKELKNKINSMEQQMKDFMQNALQMIQKGQMPPLPQMESVG